jgi:membrane dipeptidase
LSVLVKNRIAFGRDMSLPDNKEDILKGMMIIDAHAHPDEFFSNRFPKDLSSSITSMKQLGMTASVFSAVGDRQQGSFSVSFDGIMDQLQSVIDYVESGQTKLILRASDINGSIKEEKRVGCILGIEGANPLQENMQHFDDVYKKGVRIITLGHYQPNDFIDVMTAQPRHGGLSSLGRQAINKMDALGIIIDVAHASPDAIKDIAGITKRPIIDSHTSPCHNDQLPCGRYRTWKEMEIIAKTGGIVCTWPLARIKGTYQRDTFIDWAREILEMKTRLGISHIGLGTDGGGHLPARIQGYKDVSDIRKLAIAMRDVGLSRDDIAAYMGGNFYRIFHAYAA